MPLLLDEIGAYLQTQGIGILGTDLFLSLMPDQPDNCICLYEYAGSPPEYAYGVNLERPGLQVKVRNKSYTAGRQKAQDVLNALHNLRNTVLNGTHYSRILANQSPELLNRDASNRVIFVVNFSVTKERVV